MSDTLSIPTDALKILADLLAQAETRAVALTAWSAEVLALYTRRKRSTRCRMRQALRELEQLAGPEATTADLTPELIDRFGRRKGRVSTIVGLLSALRAAVRFAAKRRYVSRDLPSLCRWTLDDTDPERIRHHSRAEIRKVLDSLKADKASWKGGRLYALAAVYSYTGLRRNEALWLKKEDIDLARGFIWVENNGGGLKTRASKAAVPIPQALRPILREWLPRTGCEWVFPGVRRNCPWINGAYGKRAADQLKAAGLRVGVEGFLPHSLRHSLATHLSFHWGLTQRQVQLVLRHTTTRTQRRYVHRDLATLGELVQDFDFDQPQRSRPKTRTSRRGRVLPFKRRSRPRTDARDPWTAVEESRF